MSWNNIKNSLPIAYQSGDFDGLKSDKLLVCTIGGKFHIVEMYKGTLDGIEFCDFYNENDFEITNVAFWQEINSPI